MDFKRIGEVVQINAAEQPNEVLRSAYREIIEVAKDRGLELSTVTGAVAIDGAQQETEVIADYNKETLVKQLKAAYDGYSLIVKNINIYKRRKDPYIEGITSESLVEEFEDWFTEDKLTALQHLYQETDKPVRFTLVATPNILIDARAIIKIGKALVATNPIDDLGKPVSKGWKELCTSYTPSQLCRTNPTNGKSVQFSLIPSAYTTEVKGKFVELRARLDELQAANPGFRAPSVLEGLTYGQTICAQERLLGTSPSSSYANLDHFDLPEQHTVRDEHYYVPSTDVVYGRSIFLSETADNNGPGIISMG